MSKLKDLSVVIPTIGRNKEICQTIDFLNHGKNKPAKIVLVIPKAEIINLNIKYYKNIQIFCCNSYGQVLQRIHGFNFSKTKFTLQLDDDCLISQSSVILLKENLISLGKKTCVGPIFMSKKNVPLHAYNKNLKTKILSFLFGLPFGIKRMGKTNYTNLNFGIDPNYIKNEYVSVQWIPGGCKLMYTSELIKNNYFIFQGKAYYEDIIHSKILSDNGIRMYIIKKSVCKTETVNFTYKEIPFIKNIVRKNFGTDFIKYYIWLFLVILKKSL
tara:strand:- start:2700 stop:3512 length:813 start_codon:yes stop_codon:yes gene_type:complete